MTTLRTRGIVQEREGSSSETGRIVLGDDDGDGDGKDDRPPGLCDSDSDHDSDHDSDCEGEEIIYSRKCLTCQLVCVCPVDISSSHEELVVGETSAPSAPSSSLRKGRRE